jgi:hypothetical protein
MFFSIGSLVKLEKMKIEEILHFIEFFRDFLGHLKACV